MLEIVGSATTFVGGVVSGYVFAWLFQRISKIVFTVLLGVFALLMLFLWWLEYMGFAIINWSVFFAWMISMIFKIVEWLSLNVLSPSMSAGVFTIGFITGALIRIIHKTPCMRVPPRRRYFKLSNYVEGCTLDSPSSS